MTDTERVWFEAKLEDLCRRAERYEAAVSSFLTPAEAFAAKKYMEMRGGDMVAVFYGGYDGAERVRLLALPDYFGKEEPWTASLVRERAADVAAEAVAALEVKGSGYKKLSHRDYLGSLLGLGIERSVIGDIAVLEDSSAIVFCDGRILPFLLAEFRTVGSDRVKVRQIAISDDLAVKREFETIQDTVASPRLDAVVAALANLSREKASGLLAASFVELNYETCEKGDKTVAEGAVLSIRGYGKYVIRSLSDMTKKGRYRLVADKYK